MSVVKNLRVGRKQLYGLLCEQINRTWTQTELIRLKLAVERIQEYCERSTDLQSEVDHSLMDTEM